MAFECAILDANGPVPDAEDGIIVRPERSWAERSVERWPER